MRKLVSSLTILFACIQLLAQNVGISNTTPTEKLHVDSGSIKIGRAVWNASAPQQLLKFGDLDYITIGEEEADDKLTIKAKELNIRPSFGYTAVPLSIQGTNNYSHFYFGNNEDTYLRAGKTNGNVIINDVFGGKVGIGMGSPSRAALEQNGVVGNNAAIFGGEGSGISLQRDWPAIGFNHWYNGTHKSISNGWAAQLALNQNDGSLYYSTFNDNVASGANNNLGAAYTHFIISRKGDAFLNGNLVLNNATTGVPLKIRNTYANSNTNSNTSGIRFETDAPGGSYLPWNITGGAYFYFFNNGNFRSSINSSDGSYASISDKRYKKDISTIDDNAINKIISLRPVRYLMKEDTANSKMHIGFISQEVEQIFPELVATDKDVKMMNYTGLIPILTKGIQEQQQQINILQKENQDLKMRLDKLEKMIKNK